MSSLQSTDLFYSAVRSRFWSPTIPKRDGWTQKLVNQLYRHSSHQSAQKGFGQQSRQRPFSDDAVFATPDGVVTGKNSRAFARNSVKRSMDSRSQGQSATGAPGQGPAIGRPMLHSVAPEIRHLATLMMVAWVNASSPSWPNSAPNPDCFAPRNGMSGPTSRCLFTQTMPELIRVAT